MRCAKCKKKMQKSTFSFSTGEKICLNCKEKERQKVFSGLNSKVSISELIKSGQARIDYFV